MPIDLAGRRVIVTGAAGFIGSYVSCHLANVGAEVVAVDVAPGWRTHLLDAIDGGRIRFVPSGSRWPYLLSADVVDGADSIVHLAYAEPTDDEAEVRQETRDNLVGSLDMIDGLPPTMRSVVFASTALVYGRRRAGLLSESMPLEPDAPYSLAKVGVEQALSEWVDGERSAVSLRFATVYGPNETVPRAIPNFIRSLLDDEPPMVAVADDARDYIHVADVAEAVACALARCAPGFSAFNVGTGIRTTTAEVARLAADAMGVDVAPSIGTPRRDPVEIVLDPDHATATIGFVASTVLAQGILSEIDWFREQRALAC